MNTRKTKVVWDPRLVRVEFLDEEGNPYYCSFAASDRASGAEATVEANEAAAPGSPALPGQPKPTESGSQPYFQGGLEPRDVYRSPENALQSIRFRTRRLAMVILTGAVGEEIIIDGRIRIRILAVNPEEVHLQVNFPEFLHLDRKGVHGHQDESGTGTTLAPA